MEAVRALFLDPADARKAVQRLIEEGASLDAISLVIADGHGDAADVRPHWSNSTASEPEPLNLDPAKDDYPRTGTNSPTELSSKPPEARRDYNKRLDGRSYDSDYRGDVDREMASDLHKDRTRANATGADSDLGQGAASRRPSEVDDPIFATTVSAGKAEQLTDEHHPQTMRASFETAISSIAVPGFGTVAGHGPLAQYLARQVASGNVRDLQQLVPTGAAALVELEEAEGRGILQQCGGQIVSGSLQENRKWYLT